MGERIKVSEDKSWIKKSLENYSLDAIDEMQSKFERQRKDEEYTVMKEEEKNEFSILPSFNQKILSKALPPIVMDYMKRYEDRKQKDVFLLSLLAHISGILPNYLVMHDGEELTTNLNVFITAPAGSGKSAMTHATKFFYSIDEELSKLSDDDCFADADKEEKNKVMQPSLFIPANTSSAAMIKSLSSNNGCGIICETEADTLGNILTKDWANFDDILRKAFHNEPITMSRAGLAKILKIQNPALSVILTGTPQQVVRLIPSIENGLFSRFLYYYFKSDNSWRNVFSSTRSDVGDISDDMSQLMSAMYFSRLEGSKVLFKWTKEQATELDVFFSGLLYNSTNIYGSAINSVVYRMGLIATRLGAIIAFLNSYWTDLVSNTDRFSAVINTDQNTFELVKHLIQVQMEHSQYVFMQLPKSTDRSFTDNSAKHKFFDMLPDRFSRKDAIEIFAPKAYIATRTADGFLASFLKNKQLNKNYQGDYYKPDKFK